MARHAIDVFSLANPLYIGAVVNVYTVDEAGAKTTTLATLYDAVSGTGTLANPQLLDSEGKWKQAIYIDVPVILSISGITAEDHDTGIIAGDLAGYTNAAAASAVEADGYAELAASWAENDEDVEVTPGHYSALHHAAKAAASATEAQAAVGGVKVSADDTTADVLSSKLVAGSGISLTVVDPAGNETLRVEAAPTFDTMPSRVKNAARLSLLNLTR